MFDERVPASEAAQHLKAVVRYRLPMQIVYKPSQPRHRLHPVQKLHNLAILQVMHHQRADHQIDPRRRMEVLRQPRPVVHRHPEPSPPAPPAPRPHSGRSPSAPPAASASWPTHGSAAANPRRRTPHPQYAAETTADDTPANTRSSHSSVGWYARVSRFTCSIPRKHPRNCG